MTHVCSCLNYWSRADEPTPPALIALYQSIYEARVFLEGLRVLPLLVITSTNNIKTAFLVLLVPREKTIATSPYHLDPLGYRGSIK